PLCPGKVRYGDYIRLWGYSQYSRKGGYVGYLRRTRRKRNSVGKGELFVLPPVPATPQMDGRLHGRLGPSLFGNGGHMQITLRKSDPSMMLGAHSDVGRSDPQRPAIHYGDSCDMIAKKIRQEGSRTILPRREGVVRAPVTHLRRRHQIKHGGFIRSDGKGKLVAFTIHQAPPRVAMV
ncbi:unnamed protein product, partial [Discosporangium mesarthrocarpum]